MFRLYLYQHNSKLLQKLQWGFKRTINWNKYPSKVSTERRIQNLGYLIDPNFHRVSRTIVMSFENNADRIGRKVYFLLKVEIKDYNVIIG